MKKFLSILAISLITAAVFAQSTEKFRRDIQVYKSSPGLFLNGTGALINFNNGDLTLKQSTNTLTLDGGNLVLGNSVPISASYHKLTVIATAALNLNALNITNADVNKARTTAATASDSASVNIKFASSGNPTLTIMNKAGVQMFKADSLITSVGPILLIDATQDTTVTAAKGKIVYKASDNHFYGCVATTGKKWKALDN